MLRARRLGAALLHLPGLRALVLVCLLAAQLPVADTTLADASGAFTAKLTGSHVVPAVSTGATGTARIVVSGSTVFYQLFLTGNGSITGASLDLGAIGANGPTLFSLAVADGQVAGTLTAADLGSGATITFDAALDAIASGGTYLTVRTASAPSGELRGQIQRVVEPATFTLTGGAPPAGTPALDDIFPRTLTVGAGSIVRLQTFGRHTLTLLPAGVPAGFDTTDPTLDTPQGCGSDAAPCTFDGSAPLSVGPATGPGPLSVTVVIAAPLGDYVVHSRLQAGMVGLLRVVPAGSFEISSADDIALAIAAQLGSVPPPPPTSAYSNRLGYDISYPDCSRLSTLPAPIADGFAIVGVNSGRMFRYNPCLASLWSWAGQFALRSLYINVNAAAGPTMQQGRTGPAGTCAASDKLCYGYNYGYNAARAAWRYAYHQLGAANLPAHWWLDVEIENTWYTKPNLAANAAVIQGALDFLGSKGRYGAPSMNYVVGIYSTAYQFNRIAGSFRPNLPVWYATVEKRPEAILNRCNPATYSFTGGPVWLIQYLPGRIDANTGCP